MAAQQTPTFVLTGLGPDQATPALSFSRLGNHQFVTSLNFTIFLDISVPSVYLKVIAPAKLLGILSEEE